MSVLLRGSQSDFSPPQPSDAAPAACDRDQDSPLMALARFAAGIATDADLRLMRTAIDGYLSNSGTIPLERYLRLPNTHTAWRKSRRDSWLCKAAELIEADGHWTAAQKLEAEWNRFLTRGSWQVWRDDDAPPEYATPLSEALFYATRLNRSQSLNAKQISRIVGHIFKAKSP